MKSIMFSESMFDAVIEDRKWKTRRIIKPQPLHHPHFADFLGEWVDTYGEKVSLPMKQPRYKVGDVVYIKEPYCQDFEVVEEEHATIRQWNGKYLYKYAGDELKADKFSPFGKWKSPRFMPECAARFFLQITGVSAENVCGISDEDCFAEGTVFGRIQWSILNTQTESTEAIIRQKKHSPPYSTKYTA